MIAEDAGLSEAALREAVRSFDEPDGRRTPYELATDDGVVARIALHRLGDGTWTMSRVEQCFREP
ncbi:MAG TPA: hypothetical protein VLA82_03320 [Actinomycetota bacterium]|nr:hypothetical protein [Actinomycetota bacterium]